MRLFADGVAAVGLAAVARAMAPEMGGEVAGVTAAGVRPPSAKGRVRHPKNGSRACQWKKAGHIEDKKEGVATAEKAQAQKAAADFGQKFVKRPPR